MGRRLGRRDREREGRKVPWIFHQWGYDYWIIFPMWQALSQNMEESTVIFVHISLRL